MPPAPRLPHEEDTPLEGELISRPDLRMPDLGARLQRGLRLFWFISMAVTGWLLWLTLRGGPSGVLDVLLALLLAAPFAVLTLVMFALGQILDLMRGSSSALQAHWRANMEGRNLGLAAIKLRYTMAELRDRAGNLALLGFMATPGFIAAVGLSLLATLIMIPVALFTLLLKLF
ncbi:MAG: hypothetical protein K6346_07240 [Halothiobacillaceae bacterium]